MPIINNKNLADQVYDVLLDMIVNGKFEKGRLPSEPKLSEMLGVSRTTLRSVLSSMQQDGLINKIHGVGTFVNQRANRIEVKINEPTIVFDIISKSGHEPSLQLNDFSKRKANMLIRNKLNISENDEIIHLKRVFCADGEPAVYVEENIPCKFTQQSKNDIDILKSNSIYDIASEHLTANIRFTQTDIIPFLADQKLTEYLNCVIKEPILLMEETHLDSKSIPIIFSKVYVLDKYIRFQVSKRDSKK